MPLGMKKGALTEGVKHLIKEEDGSSMKRPSRDMKLGKLPCWPAHIVDKGSKAKSRWHKIYAAAAEGDLQLLKKMLFEDLECPISDLVTTQGRTALHVVATTCNSSCGEELITLILQRGANLLLAVDHAGDTALHLAAGAGNLVTVKDLVRFAKERLTTEAVASFSEKKNYSTGTALHVALKNYSSNESEVARFLAAEYPKVEMDRDFSLLYLAVMCGDLEVVKKLLEKKTIMPAKGSKPLAHAAIEAKNSDIFKAILSNEPSLIDTFDERGRSPLSFAAQSGDLDSVLYILDNFPDCACKRDHKDDGFFPIHSASSAGHREIVAVFLQECLDTCELLTHKQRNILHVAAEGGRARVVKYLLERKDELGKRLVNEGDEMGDTPLHLAAKFCHPKVVSLLTWDKRVRLNLKNNDGLTALDLAQDPPEQVTPFQQLLTLAALKSVGVPKSVPGKHMVQPSGLELFKERVNTLLLVATLVATVTFACGFTLPGGNDDDSGTAKLLSEPMFQAFLICNTISMYSSIFAVVILIAAQLEDASLILTALRVALPLIGLALATMSFAFTAGAYLVTRRLEWLAILLLALGSTFTGALMALYLQLCAPLSPRGLVLRHLFRHTFCLMVWATGSDKDSKG